MSGSDARLQCCVRLPPLCCSFGGEGFLMWHGLPPVNSHSYNGHLARFFALLIAPPQSPLSNQPSPHTNSSPQSLPKSAIPSTSEYAPHSPPPRWQSPPL